VPIPLTLGVTEGHTLVDADGLAIRDNVQPGTDFYLRPAPGASAPGRLISPVPTDIA
jgi:hypothetical protein